MHATFVHAGSSHADTATQALLSEPFWKVTQSAVFVGSLWVSARGLQGGL